MSTSEESTGLNLFDEKASAVGNFPTALRGYDRSAVDDYVRSLENRVVQAGRERTDWERRISELQGQLAATRKELAGRPTGEVDYSSLGARAGHILKMAEEQAQEMLDQANRDANKLREEGQRDADRLRHQAEADGEQIRKNGRVELAQLRQRASQEAQAEVERARAEAAAVGAAAEREVEALRRQAHHDADSARQTGYLEGQQHKKNAEAEVARLRQQVAEEREAATAELKRMHQESVTATGKLLSEATQHHQQAGERLAADIAASAAARTDAQAEAEKIRLDAKEEAERVLAAAKRQADRIVQRTNQEFEWRKEQLRRETENLMQRKQAVLNQLQSLSALASQSAGDVPQMKPLADLSDDLERYAEEPGPVDESSAGSPADQPSVPSGDDPTLPDAGGSQRDSSVDDTIDETVVRPAVTNGGPGQQSSDNGQSTAQQGHNAEQSDNAEQGHNPEQGHNAEQEGLDAEDDDENEPTITVKTDVNQAAGRA